VDKELIKITDKLDLGNLLIQKSITPSMVFNLISKNLLTCSKPVFASLSELKSGRKS